MLATLKQKQNASVGWLQHDNLSGWEIGIS
jgi:hypothetical protein